MPALRGLLGQHCTHALRFAASRPALAGPVALTTWCRYRPAEGYALLRPLLRASNAVDLQSMSTAGTSSQQLDIAVGVIVEGRPLNRDR